MNTKTYMLHSNKRHPLNYRLLTWDRHINIERVKQISGISILPKTWYIGVTVYHNMKTIYEPVNKGFIRHIYIKNKNTSNKHSVTVVICVS